MLNRELMQQWIEALRSGKFEQGVGHLKMFNLGRNTTHCALGVLGEITGELEWTYAWKLKGSSLIGSFSPALIDKMGMDIPYISLLNDRDRFTFEQIADYLEANYLLNTPVDVEEVEKYYG